MCALVASVTSCEEFDPMVPDSPREVSDIKVRAGISDDEFCRNIDIENIHHTIPIVNRYINNLPADMDAKQRAQAMVAFFKSFAGIIDSWLFQNEYMQEPAVFFSFMDGPTERELGLHLSSTGKCSAITTT